MEIMLQLLAWVWIRQVKNKNRKMRRFKTRPVFRHRNVLGEMHVFHQIYAHDSEIFHKSFRMTTEQFDQLLLLLHASISKGRQNYSDSISSRQRLDFLCNKIEYLANSFNQLPARFQGQ